MLKYDSPPSLQRSFCQRDWKGYPRSTKTGKLVLSKEEEKKRIKYELGRRLGVLVECRWGSGHPYEWMMMTV